MLLANLLKGDHTRKRKLEFTPEAREAFVELKKRFTSAPTLVEVDVSEVRLGAVLSQ